MSRTNEDLKALFKGKPEDRESVLLDDIVSLSYENIDALSHLIERELYCLALDAQKHSNLFWTEKKATADKGEKYGYFGTRVRIIESSFQAVWYKNKPLPNGKVFSEHITKGKSQYRYPDRSFKTAEPHERELIEIVESRYEVLRKRSAVLRKLRSAITGYRKLLSSEE